MATLCQSVIHRLSANFLMFSFLLIFCSFLKTDYLFHYKIWSFCAIKFSRSFLGSVTIPETSTAQSSSSVTMLKSFRPMLQLIPSCFFITPAKTFEMILLTNGLLINIAKIKEALFRTSLPPFSSSLFCLQESIQPKVSSFQVFYCSYRTPFMI